MAPSETIEVHERHINDTRTVLAVTFYQKDEAGDWAVVDLTGKTVTFKMTDEEGSEVIAETGTGVDVQSPATDGKVNYDFSAAGVTTPGTYWGRFIATESGEGDHFPVKRELKIVLFGD